MLARWEPLRLGNFGLGMDRLFDHFLGHPHGHAGNGWFRPALEVTEDEGGLTVRAEVPGVERDKLDVKVDGRLLTISGTKEERREEKKEGEEGEEAPERTYHIVESRYGSFTRTIELPEYVDSENSEADYADGVLSIVFQKKAEAKPKQLEIHVK